MTDHPDAKDYRTLFEMYGGDMSDIYLDTDEEHYRLLFEQVVRLLVKPSGYNATLPEPFRLTAQRYLDGHEDTVVQMEQAENRNFMLSDLYDFIRLTDAASRDAS
ncbi:hypothetical protein [Magnetospira sp. QH-2]|uniref:hypothetical protein n=1 Tax=Magnetospira sp. (strain QH-2) TaxID=1288970 RepID=UPI0003E80E51|nr:hypothetical protein [Magnetospira sp. QH-2]CCQ74869.1 conserved protein of unknown function [Magnetospira sp. QH-2]